MRDTTWLNGTNLAQSENPFFRPHPLSRFFFIGIVATFLTLFISMIFSGFRQGNTRKPAFSEFLLDSSLQ